MTNSTLTLTRLLGAVVSAFLVVALAACTTTSTSAPQPQAPPSAGATTAPDPDSSEPTASPEPALPPDPKAATKVVPVERSVPAPKKRIEAKAGNSESPVQWSDGVKLAVLRIEQRTSDAIGPGGTNGAPLTTFTVRLENGSDRPLDATGVVVTGTYGGKARQLATPVYDERSADFGARLAPGKSVQATYSFSIPRGSLDAVELSFDLDSRHGVGTFKDAAR